MSNYLQHSDVVNDVLDVEARFGEFLEENAVKCNACYGTGLDRYEDVDCLSCWGEGSILITS